VTDRLLSFHLRFPKDQKRKEFWNRMPLFSFTFMQCPLTIKFFGASSWALPMKIQFLFLFSYLRAVAHEIIFPKKLLTARWKKKRIRNPGRLLSKPHVSCFSFLVSGLAYQGFLFLFEFFSPTVMYFSFLISYVTVGGNCLAERKRDSIANAPANCQALKRRNYRSTERKLKKAKSKGSTVEQRE